MKRILLPILGILLLAACEKETTSPIEPEADQFIDLRSGCEKEYWICHKAGKSGRYSVLCIDAEGYFGDPDDPEDLGHSGHADDHVLDADGDGFTAPNPCGLGSQDDCDDDNAAINPDAEEICDNGVDDDCDGDIDEADEDCIQSCQSKHVRDEFNQVSFRNNDGIDNWNGPWIENDPESGGSGPSAGQVQVLNGELRIDDEPDTGGGPSASREINLSGGISATFSFDFRTSTGVDADDTISVEASSNGGANWTVLESITGITGISAGSRSYDISAFISPNTTIRFRVSNLYGGSNEYFFVDDVQITSSCN